MSYSVSTSNTDGTKEHFEYLQDEEHVESLVSMLLARVITKEITITLEGE